MNHAYQDTAPGPLPLLPDALEQARAWPTDSTQNPRTPHYWGGWGHLLSMLPQGAASSGHSFRATWPSPPHQAPAYTLYHSEEHSSAAPLRQSPGSTPHGGHT